MLAILRKFSWPAHSVSGFCLKGIERAEVLANAAAQKKSQTAARIDNHTNYKGSLLLSTNFRYPYYFEFVDKVVVEVYDQPSSGKS